MGVLQCANFQNPWTIFLETLPPDLPLAQMPSFDKERDILLFFKFYDPVLKRLNYCGLGYFNLNKKIAELIPEMNNRVGWSIDTELTIYEEQGINIIQKIQNHNETLDTILKAVRDAMESAIIIFEKKTLDGSVELSTCEEYVRDLLYRIEVTFFNKVNPSDPGFTLELSQRSNYDQMAQAVGQKIDVDPYRIQFFKCQNYKDIPGNPIRYQGGMTLKDILVLNKSKGVKKLFYQRLSMNITELEFKKQFKCLWLSINMKEEKELILYPPKTGTIKDLLEEAAKQVEMNADEGSGQLRIVEIVGHKLMPGPDKDDQLEFINVSCETNISNPKVYRIEEIPRNELNLAEDELLVPVSHFYKNVYNTFGIPFYVKIKQGELFTAVKERMQKRLGVADKEWEKYKFGIVTMSHIEYITDDKMTIALSDFKNNTAAARPYLGLEHINKSQQRSRYNYFEKAIKIYN